MEVPGDSLPVIATMVGNDYTRGLPGVGMKRAIGLVKESKVTTLDGLLALREVRSLLGALSPAERQEREASMGRSFDVFYHHRQTPAAAPAGGETPFDEVVRLERELHEGQNQLRRTLGIDKREAERAGLRAKRRNRFMTGRPARVTFLLLFFF